VSLETLTDYYSSLLPYQTRGLPNAVRQVKLWCALMTGEGLPEATLTAYDLDTAVGAQLDILGKYIGVPRNIGLPQARPYFGLWAYASATALDPDKYQGVWTPSTNSPAITPVAVGAWWVTNAAGTSVAPIAATFACGDVIRQTGAGPTDFVHYTTGTPNGNGLISYNDLGSNAYVVFYRYAFASGQNTDLSDDDYRTVLKLKIVLNSSNGTLASIMDYLYQFFGTQIALVDNKDMTLTYSIQTTVQLSNELLEIFLPRPMGVGITITGFVPPTPGEVITTEGGTSLTTESGDELIT
jgi:hypothetical protein